MGEPCTSVPADCSNGKCRLTGACIDTLPVVEGPPTVADYVSDRVFDGVRPLSADSVAYLRKLADAKRAKWAANALSLPDDSTERKGMPICSGVLDYFPNALAEVARVSKFGNDKHNPGQPIHHARGKSMDHADCIVRHLIDRGKLDGKGMRHSAYVAWRALALLQEELERELGLPLPRGARAGS